MEAEIRSSRASERDPGKDLVAQPKGQGHRHLTIVLTAIIVVVVVVILLLL